ncbi:MAG: DUF3833 domain-containing protein [Rhodospirillales bacterium]|nr:DUF3833 domain-containing protein [Rhodospirillales bacterium]
MTRLSRLLLIAPVLALGSCGTMKPEDFADRGPALVLEDYFSGRTKAWGIFEDRFGDLRREFVVDIDGSWDGRELVLDEQFVYADGETDRRVWRIVRTGEHSYRGEAADVVGPAEGTVYGNALNWRYDFDLDIGERTIRVSFDDWMFLQPDGILINRAKVRKWGFELGSVTLFFRRTDGMDDGAKAVTQ